MSSKARLAATQVVKPARLCEPPIVRASADNRGMMKLLLVASLVVSVVAAAAGPADLVPPVVSESFTPLPCPAKPKTTLDFEGCAERRILSTDKAINARVKRIFLVLQKGRSRSAVARFVRGERAWLAYRRAVCLSRADVYEGGSQGGVLFADCEADANAVHLKDLRRFQRGLTH
jgi:uncharacterized protein YecT (DUF1311 family)